MSRLRRQNTLVIQPIQQHDLPHPGPSTTHPSHPSTANASSSTSRALPTTSEATPATANVVTTTTNSLPDTSPSLQFYADEEAPFDGGASDVRVAVQNLGQKPNILPREMGTLKRADLEAADTVSLKRLAKILMVPHHKSREEIINHIFAQRAVVPKPRKHRSLRVAATEKGIVKRNGIDKGLARPGLKVVKDYNPHKEAISAKARQEMGPQSPVPTDVGSPPPNVADVPEPENRPSCILDKGKGVDRSLDGDNSVAPSPYERPARVPLGRLVPADFSRPGMPTPAESTSDSDDYEPEVIENEVDPTQGEDSRRVYTYPPPNPQSPGWLATMGWRIQQETEGLTQEVDSVRATIDAAVVQGSLTDAELRRVRETYRKLAESIGRVAGPQFMQRLFERALEIEGELEPFEEDTYVDEDRGENQALPVEQYAYNPAEGAQAQGMMPMAVDNSRPSDTLSYLDRSSAPPTSPLAHVPLRLKRRREQLAPSPSQHSVEGTPSATKRRRLSADEDDDSFQPSHSPSCGMSPEIPYNAGLQDETAVASSPGRHSQLADEESGRGSSLGEFEGDGYTTDNEAVDDDVDELMDYEEFEGVPVDIPALQEDHASDSGVDVTGELNEAGEETSPEPSEQGAIEEPAQRENAAAPATSPNGRVAGTVFGAAVQSPQRATRPSPPRPRAEFPNYGYTSPLVDWHGRPIRRRNEIPWENGGWRSPTLT